MVIVLQTLFFIILVFHKHNSLPLRQIQSFISFYWRVWCLSSTNSLIAKNQLQSFAIIYPCRIIFTLNQTLFFESKSVNRRRIYREKSFILSEISSAKLISRSFIHFKNAANAKIWAHSCLPDLCARGKVIFQKAFLPSKSSMLAQCDQIWRNFDTLAKI